MACQGAFLVAFPQTLRVLRFDVFSHIMCTCSTSLHAHLSRGEWQGLWQPELIAAATQCGPTARHMAPSARAVTRFARATGDLHSLSTVDLRLMALARTLEVAAHGDAHLRDLPVCVCTCHCGQGRLCTIQLSVLCTAMLSCAQCQWWTSQLQPCPAAPPVSLHMWCFVS